MKASIAILAALSGAAFAAHHGVGITDAPLPETLAADTRIVRRQTGGKMGGKLGGGGRKTVMNELKEGGCKKVTLVFARASTEPGNMGGSMGPIVCAGLKKDFNNDVACQGVGGAYSAGLMDNVSPAGTTKGAIAEATKMFTETHTKCPNSIIVAGGYSQGTAVIMNAVKDLPAPVKNKVVGVVLFGYTKNGQQKSGIPNYPKEKVSVYCAQSDGVCWGKLNVTPGHFVYMNDGSGPKSIAFLKKQINSGAGKSSEPAAAETEEPSEEAAKPAKSAAKGKAASKPKSAEGTASTKSKGSEGMAGHSHGSRRA